MQAKHVCAQPKRPGCSASLRPYASALVPAPTAAGRCPGSSWSSEQLELSGEKIIPLGSLVLSSFVTACRPSLRAHATSAIQPGSHKSGHAHAHLRRRARTAWLFADGFCQPTHHANRPFPFTPPVYPRLRIRCGLNPYGTQRPTFLLLRHTTFLPVQPD